MEEVEDSDEADDLDEQLIKAAERRKAERKQRRKSRGEA